MTALESFLHATDDGLPVLVRIGLAHVQLETIHPFLDGNGRIGRMLITFLLCHAGVLQDPLLYLSLYLKQNRSEYYRLLSEVRFNGNWEEWLEFFLMGILETAEAAVSTARHLSELFATDKERISQLGRQAGSALRVHEALMALPIRSIPDVSRIAGLSYPGASAGMQRLVDLGIAREITGGRRGRLFVYTEYLGILSEGTEPL